MFIVPTKNTSFSEISNIVQDFFNKTCILFFYVAWVWLSIYFYSGIYLKRFKYVSVLSVCQNGERYANSFHWKIIDLSTLWHFSSSVCKYNKKAHWLSTTNVFGTLGAINFLLLERYLEKLAVFFFFGHISHACCLYFWISYNLTSKRGCRGIGVGSGG